MEGIPIPTTLHPTNPPTERAMLAAVRWNENGWTTDDSLEELARLAESADLEVVGSVAQNLSRQTMGGVGLRGPGETQLEVDRRRAQERVTLLKEELAEVHAHREQYRQKRRKAGVPIVALVGYTNAGKSTLLNRLTDATVLAENKLFATLDPTTRKIALPSGRDALLTDTVGFINHL